jgi:NH3-dependent NAD+ synthetase
MPISQLLKYEVYSLAFKLGVNEEIINRAPTAGL